MKYTCKYCNQSFTKENTLMVHMCIPKKRHLEQNETGVRFGLAAYLQFFEMTQGSAKKKTFEDFAKSPYYSAFVKFGWYCVQTRVIAVPHFTAWLLKNNKKLDRWCSDKLYEEFLIQYLRTENVMDALDRALEYGTQWEEETGKPAKDCIRYGSHMRTTDYITRGKISPWVLYNCESGQQFLEDISKEQQEIIWPYIDPAVWMKKLHDYAADREIAQAVLKEVGW